MSAAQAPKQVKISEVRRLLKEGYTRWENEATEPGKSIQAYFSLRFSDCKILFDHPKVKGLKTRIVTFQIIDDTEGTDVVTNVSDDEDEAEDTQAPVATPQAVEDIMTGATPVAVIPEPTSAEEIIVPSDELVFD